jgi:hypothetical protein
MNKRLADLFGSKQFPWLLSIDPDATADDGGGGLDDADDEELGETGVKTLREERATRKALEKKLAQLEAQFNYVKDLNPDTYREAQRKADELQRQLQERETLTAAEKQRIEQKALEQVRKATTVAEAEKNRRIELEIETLAQGVFSAAEGRDGADASGMSFFKAWMKFHGRDHFKKDEVTGKLYVVDGDGDRVKTPEGNDVDPVAWLQAQADTSQVIGTFFRPKGGEGSGGFVGARGVRSVQGLTPEQVKAMSPSEKLAYHREVAARK